MADQWWSWALSIIGATCFYLAGKKVWWTWYLGLFTQLLWLGYTLVTQQWGFLVGVVLYTFVYSKNARDWTRDHFRLKRGPVRFADDFSRPEWWRNLSPAEWTVLDRMEREAPEMYNRVVERLKGQ